MIAILGCGGIGYKVAKSLLQKDQILILDKNPSRVENLVEQGLNAKICDITKKEEYPPEIQDADVILILHLIMRLTRKLLRL